MAFLTLFLINLLHDRVKLFLLTNMEGVGVERFPLSLTPRQSQLSVMTVG